MSAIAPPHDRLLELFLEVAAIEALSGRERPLADYVAGRLSALGLEVVEEPAPEGGNAGNVVARHRGGGDLLLTCHMDTARPSGAVRPQIGADRLTSDGTTVLGVDNRVGVATLLFTAERLLRELGDAAPPFSLAFMVREETDLAGSRSLELDPSWKRAYVFDSSLRPGHFIHASWGAKRFSAEVLGRAAHSGLSPERGIDAIAVTARALAGLTFGRLDDATTANVGRLEAGSAINTVPERAWLEGEIRAREEARAEQVLADIARRFEIEAAAAGARVHFSDAWDFRPFLLELESAACVELRAAMERVGLTPTPVLSAGGSDANWLNARGLPALNLGIGAQNPHGDDEFILFEDLVANAELALALVSASV